MGTVERKDMGAAMVKILRDTLAADDRKGLLREAVEMAIQYIEVTEKEHRYARDVFFPRHAVEADRFDEAWEGGVR